MPASPSTQPTQVAMPVSQVVPTATELALPKKPLVGRPSETTLPAQVGLQAGVMPTGRVPQRSAAERVSILRARPLQPPAPVTAQPQRGISRRTVVLGLAGLAVVGVAGGGLIWLARSQQSVGTTLYTYHGHSNIVRAVAWNPVRGTGTLPGGQVMPNGRRIASASSDWTVQVWDAVDGGNVFTYRGHSQSVDAVAWSPNGKRIASGGGNSLEGTVQVWDAVGGDSVAVDGGNIYTYHGHSGAVLAVAWSLDGKDIASGSRDKTVQVWVAE